MGLTPIGPWVLSLALREWASRSVKPFGINSPSVNLSMSGKAVPSSYAYVGPRVAWTSALFTGTLGIIYFPMSCKRFYHVLEEVVLRNVPLGTILDFVSLAA